MPQIISIIGKSGCGKGTQAKLLSEKLRLPLIMMSDMLRQEIATSSELGLKLDTWMKNGDFINGDIIQFVTEKFLPKDYLKSGFIFDGSNRTISQTVRFDYFLWKQDLKQDKVFWLDISDEVALKRRISRNEEAMKVGKILREDDKNIEIFKHRLSEFQIDFLEIRQYFEMKGSLVQINGELTIEEIHNQILQNLK